MKRISFLSVFNLVPEDSPIANGFMALVFFKIISAIYQTVFLSKENYFQTGLPNLVDKSPFASICCKGCLLPKIQPSFVNVRILVGGKSHHPLVVRSLCSTVQCQQIFTSWIDELHLHKSDF